MHVPNLCKPALPQEKEEQLHRNCSGGDKRHDIHGGPLRDERLRQGAEEAHPRDPGACIILKTGIYGFSDYKEVIEKVKKVEHVKAVAPFVEGPALIRLRGAKEFAYFRGIDTELEAQVGDLGSYLNIFGTRPKDLNKVHGETEIYSIFAGSELTRLTPGTQKKNPKNLIPKGEHFVLNT